MSDLEKALHDINNSLGTLVINIEVIAEDPAIKGFARDAATAALLELQTLENRIKELRAFIPG